ncbi:MAG TPA: homoserine kinase [Herpetosiphonaceae bacterium]
MRITVRVPASSANLGCGFDALGLALALHSDFVFDTDAPDALLAVAGDGADALLADGCGLVYEAAERYCSELGVELPRFSLTVENRIPLSRGLGSSSAAVVGGLAGAWALHHADQPGAALDRSLLLRLATAIEGHPDNVAPALFGGIQLAVVPGGDPLSGAAPLLMPLAAPPTLAAACFIPDMPISTSAARAVLPPAVPLADAVHNQARTALFAAIFGQPAPPLGLLREAMDDRLHQPYRAALLPQLPGLIDAACAAGAYGAALSGAGSTVLALCDLADAQRVAEAMRRFALAPGGYPELPGAARVLALDLSGAQLRRA